MTFTSYEQIKVRCISETIQFTEYLMYFLLQARDLLLNSFSSKIHFLTCHMDVGEKLLPTAISWSEGGRGAKKYFETGGELSLTFINISGAEEFPQLSF